MSTNSLISIWGCVICANVATGAGRPALGLVWTALAGIAWVLRDKASKD